MPVAVSIMAVFDAIVGFVGVIDIATSLPEDPLPVGDETPPPPPQLDIAVTRKHTDNIDNIFFTIFINPPCIVSNKKPPEILSGGPADIGLKYSFSPVALRPKVSPGLLWAENACKPEAVSVT
jgi:hypothetical protein